MKEFSKKIVMFLLINSVVWIYLSYILAFKGKEQIAESLSTAVVAQVIGVVLLYSLKALFENLSKNNNWPDKSCIKNEETQSEEEEIPKEGV